MTSLREQHSMVYLYVAMELGQGAWRLAFSDGRKRRPRRRNVEARDWRAVLREIDLAKKRFGLSQDAPVVCCYEAGRDGFWLHRFLTSEGILNVVVDSSSIEVNRRQRRAKNDRLDADKLLSMLIRWHRGDEHVWSIVQVPSEEDEDGRRLHRELQAVKGEQTRHNNRIKALLISVGIHLEEVNKDFSKFVDAARQWDGQPLPAHLRQQLLREFERMQLANRQIRTLEAERARQIRDPQAGRQVNMVRQLMMIRGIGVNSSWLYVKELFGWRKFKNRRQLGALVGLTPTPYSSGNSEREQGITKAGNRRLRSMTIEIAWGWLRYQPRSQLTRWYMERFAKGSKRQRRIGIVALARKLLIVLWKYLKDGEITDGFEWREGSPAISYTQALS